MIVVNGKFLGAGPTAVHRVAQELTRALWARREGRGVKLRSPRLSGEIANDPGVPHVETGRLDGLLWEQLSLPMSLTKEDILLNLCNMTPLLRRRAVTMVHDAQVFTFAQSYGARSYWARVHARCAGRMQPALLTVSDFARRELAELGLAPIESIHVIPNGADHVLRVIAENDVITRLGLSSRAYALALSNLQVHKNIPLLLRAFSAPDLQALPLVLVGRAGRADFVAAGHSVPPNVIFAGFVTDGEMRSLQENALAFCTPSLTEGFGLPPIEAMLLGTPAVIAPCGALPEVCGPDMPQASAQDPGDWIRTLLRLRDNRSYLPHLQAAGRRRAADFTWDAAAAKLEQVLHHIFGPVATEDKGAAKTM